MTNTHPNRTRLAELVKELDQQIRYTKSAANDEEIAKLISESILEINRELNSTAVVVNQLRADMNIMREQVATLKLRVHGSVEMGVVGVGELNAAVRNLTKQIHQMESGLDTLKKLLWTVILILLGAIPLIIAFYTMTIR